jgi:hypothetical protein
MQTGMMLSVAMNIYGSAWRRAWLIEILYANKRWLHGHCPSDPGEILGESASMGVSVPSHV